MRPQAILILFLTIWPLLHLTAAAPTEQAAVAETLSRLVTHNHGHGGGLVRIAGPQGVLVTTADGRMAGPDSALMTPDTPFEIASITKAVTAATILRLVEQGRLTLDTTLAEALPKETGFPRTITIRQLLSHTSGLGNYWDDGKLDREGNNAFLRAFLAAPDQPWLPEQILTYSRQLPHRREGRFHYSDTNYVLLGLIIERTTRQPLQRAYRDLIFDPLGMSDTWLTYKESPRGAAPSHRYEGSEDLHSVPRQSADWAGGGLVSTARDLERFLRGLASGRLFRQATTLDAMRESVPVGEDSITYGLGLYRVDLGQGRGELWGHDGHGNSFAYYWPQRDITFTGTLNQTENDWWPLVEAYLADRPQSVDLSENDSPFEISLSTGWDSLYMNRGLNCLPNENGYGSGLYWIALDLTWSITDVDFLSIGLWNAYATQGTPYSELDVALFYTRQIGDLSLSVGYQMCYGVSEGNYYSHELHAIIAYDFTLGPATITPSIGGLFNLGPDADGGIGLAPAGSGFITFRVDGDLPLYKETISLAPWTAFGLNLGYNTKNPADEDSNPPSFSGANNIECGLALPIRITSHFTVSPYAAYSYALADLIGTAPSTFWGGVSLVFTY